MKSLGRKTVIEYSYENEQEAEMHEKRMAKDGWHVDSRMSYFIKHYRSYSQRNREGVFF